MMNFIPFCWKRVLSWIIPEVSDPELITLGTLLLFRKNRHLPVLEEFSENDWWQYGKLRYKRAQFLANSFWQRWRREYVTTLHKRHKWKTREAYLREGDIVLIKNKMAKRNEWLFGRVVDCKKSEDGLARSVSLRLPLLPGSNKPRTTKRCIQYPWPGTHCSFCDTFYRMYQILPINWQRAGRCAVQPWINKVYPSKVAAAFYFFYFSTLWLLVFSFVSPSSQS